MTVSARGSRTRRPSPEAPTHQFGVGQVVRMKSYFGTPSKTPEVYRITGTLPARDNSFQYRIRSDDERHERVASEDSLELAGEPAPARGTTLIERTFGNGQGTEAQHARTSETETGQGSAQT